MSLIGEGGGGTGCIEKTAACLDSILQAAEGPRGDRQALAFI